MVIQAGWDLRESHPLIPPLVGGPAATLLYKILPWLALQHLAMA
jgi:hypothetical protein